MEAALIEGSRSNNGRPPTIYDVADRAGVSHQTVSRFLIGREGVRQRNRVRIEAALDELGYRANVAARTLRTGRTGLISLAIPSLNQPYFAELAQAVVSAATPLGLTVFVQTMEHDRDRELSVVSRARGALVDGIIFAPTALTSADLERIDVDIPLVLLGDSVTDPRYVHIGMQNLAGARQAVQHLLGLGRRRIVALGAEPPDAGGAAALRLRGYREAFATAGQIPDESLIVEVGEWVKESGVRAIARLFESGASFDAVFAFNDALALGALRGLLRSGIRVPEDVAVVGFDNTVDAQFSTPSLSSVDPGTRLIGSAAVEHLHLLIDSSGDSPPRTKLQLPAKLVTRESTIGY